MRINKAAFWVTLIAGIIIILIGIIFKINDVTSAGASAGRNVLPASSVTLNYVSLFIIGTIIIILSILIRFDKKNHNEEMKYLDSVIYKKKNIKKRENVKEEFQNNSICTLYPKN
jgi:cytochrome b subunit of formate dehydrogenase